VISIRIGEKMTVRWGVRRDDTEPKYAETIGFNRRSENIYLRISDGLGILANRQSENWGRDGFKGNIKIGQDKLFDYWNETSSPTEEDIYTNYYAGNEALWRPKLQEYRKVVNFETPTLKKLLVALYPVLDSLVDGDYILNVCDMLPTTGEGTYFYQYSGLEKVKDSSTIEMPLFQGASSMDAAFPLYLIPTQSEALTNMTFNNQDGLNGIGITLGFRGFDNYLIDGHHKAKRAFQQHQTFPCISICSLGGGIRNVDFREISDFPVNMNYYLSTISDYRFLDYPTTEDIVMTYDYFYEFLELPLAEQAIDLELELVKGQSQEEMLRIIQGLFYSHNVSEYLKLEHMIRFDYPFPVIHRRYYGLLTNWLAINGVQEILLQFLIDKLSDDDQLNQFIAERIVEIGTL